MNIYDNLTYSNINNDLILGKTTILLLCDKMKNLKNKDFILSEEYNCVYYILHNGFFSYNFYKETVQLFKITLNIKTLSKFEINQFEHKLNKLQHPMQEMTWLDLFHYIH